MNSTRTNMNTNNNQTVRKSTYSSTTFIIIVGVLSVVFIGVYMYNAYKASLLLITSVTVPATMCPDYWDSLGNGKCKNSQYLGSCSKDEGANVMDFSGEIFTNQNTGNYSKCKWATACGVSWSGVDRLC